MNGSGGWRRRRTANCRDGMGDGACVVDLLSPACAGVEGSVVDRSSAEDGGFPYGRVALDDVYVGEGGVVQFGRGGCILRRVG